MATEQVKQTGR